VAAVSLRPPRRPAPRTVGGWVALAAVLTLLGGRAGLLLAAAVVVWDLLLGPAPRTLLLASLLAFVALPVTVLARGLPSRATLSPDFAAGSLLPHLLAGSGLALLVLGVLREVRASLPPAQRRRELEPPPAAGGGRALQPRRRGEGDPGDATDPGEPR